MCWSVLNWLATTAFPRYSPGGEEFTVEDFYLLFDYDDVSISEDVR